MQHPARKILLLFNLPSLLWLGLVLIATDLPAEREPSPEAVRESGAEASPPQNELADAAGPYLRAHADNPVAWREWGEQALGEARERNKPIFLSIGYSACHWCHVMERESFMDPEIAAVINENFIPIKVDREQRPDLDHVYMQVYQAMSGSSGGWPLNIFLSPNLTPFYGATYLPPVERHGLPAFPNVLEELVTAWAEEPQIIEGQGQRVRDIMDELHQVPGDAQALPPAEQVLSRATNALAARFDPGSGGFGLAPKFPQTLHLNLLLLRRHQSGDAGYLDMADTTLREMIKGGIYDRIGGGFHRYTVDDQWAVPHFEKMLYDNALLSELALDLWRISPGTETYRRVVMQTLDFILRELHHPAGGFYSSLSAESDGVEGAYYTWLPEEIKLAFSSVDDGHELETAFFNAYELTPIPLPEGHEGTERGAIAVAGRDLPEFTEELARARRILKNVRDQRTAPERDEKILASWNGYAISALAKAGFALDEPRYIQAASRAAEFVLSRMMAPADGKLSHSWFDGAASDEGFLEDYAAMAQGLTDLYQVTGQERWIKLANLLAVRLVRQFRQPAQGVFYMTREARSDLPVRPLDLQDDTTAAGNSLAARVLARLATLLDKPEYREIAEECNQAVLRAYRDNYELVPMQVETYWFLENSPPELAVVGPVDAPATRQISREIGRRYLPGALLAIRRIPHAPSETVEAKEPRETDEEALVALLRGKTLVEGQPALYICRNYVCKEPLTDLEEIKDALEALAKPDRETE